MKAQLFTDGGSRGNPGPGAAGAYLVLPDKKHHFSEYLGHTTNNQAEYRALILGLTKTSELKIHELECFLDSELVVKQLRKIYKVKDAKIKPLFAEAEKLARRFKYISFTHIPRVKNKIADSLVNKELDKKRSL